MKTKQIYQMISIALGTGFIISLFFHSKDWLNSFLMNLLYALVFTIVNFLYFNWIGKKCSWEKETKKTFLFSMAGMIPLNVSTFFLLNWLTSILYYGNAFSDFLANQNILSYFIVVLISCVIALFIITLQLLKNMNRTSYE